MKQTKFFKPIKRTKNMIDLTDSYGYDYAAAVRASEDRITADRKWQESVEIIGQPEYQPQPIPTYTPYKMTPKEALRVVKGMIIREILALRP